MDGYLHAWRNYATFAGRARRAEFWEFLLVHVLVLLGLSAIAGNRMPFWGGGMVSIGWLRDAYALAALLPKIAVMVRRLHDIDRSGWGVLIAALPGCGMILLLLFFFTEEGSRGANRYGADPRAQAA